MAGCSFTGIDPIYVKQLFYFGVIGVKLQFEKSQDLFLHIFTQPDNNSPVLFNCFFEIRVFLPVLLVLYLLDRKLQHFAFGFYGFTVIDEESYVVR
jgi:hypothetical protein